jgi:hypothetical protein
MFGKELHGIISLGMAAFGSRVGKMDKAAFESEMSKTGKI